MKWWTVLCLVLIAAAAPARAGTVIEVLGRVAGNGLTTGPWAGARPGEYVSLTFQVADTGAVPSGSSCGSNMRRYALVQGSLHMRIHGQTLDAPLAAGGGGNINPSCLMTDNCPVADVIMFEGGGGLALPGTGTPLYGMVFELHDSTGTLWNSSIMSQNLGLRGQSAFDYVEWNVGSLTISYVGMNIITTTEQTGACCLGDGYCTVLSQGLCGPGDWNSEGSCATNPCPPSGACCLPSGGCTLTTQARCESFPGSIYNGDNTTCTSASCPPTSACCLGGTCNQLIEHACTVAGGAWQPPVESWLGTIANCDIQPQHFRAHRINLPDATGTTTVTPGVFTSTISISDTTPVQSVEVWLGLGLPRINDVRIRLTGPNGYTADLVTRIGATPPTCTTTPVGPGYVMYDTLILQDAAPQTFYQHVLSLPTGSLVPGGRYRAASCGGTPVNLDAPSPNGFGGIPMAGDWTLEVRDERTGIQTYLNAWGLSFNGGNQPPCVVTCGTSDFNCDGDYGTDQDIEAFFACLGGHCPPAPCTSSADFNQDGDTGTDQDIEAFFRVLGGGHC